MKGIAKIAIILLHITSRHIKHCIPMCVVQGEKKDEIERRGQRYKISVGETVKVEYFFSNLYVFKCLFLRERERESEHKRGRGRERGRQRIHSRLQTLSCQHRALLKAQTHEQRDHDLSLSQMLN